MQIRLRIDFAYDGSPFAGFARQPDQQTVQGVLEDALTRLLGKDASGATTCAGRTDAGVHAEAQTVHLDVPSSWRFTADLPRLRQVLNRLVGPAITITSTSLVEPTFSARFDAVLRQYRYRLFDGEALPPLWRHHTWQVKSILDVDAMHAAGQCLVGEHDFSSFCRRRMVLGPDGTEVVATNVRRITRLCVSRPTGDDLITIEVDGTAFCHQMIRSITGTLVEVGRGRRRVVWVAEALAAKNRSAAGPVAPPHGLSLIGVEYPPTRT